MMFSRLFRPKTRRIELDLTDAQIVQLRAVMDGLPLNPYSGLVAAVVKRLPLESDAVPSNTGADADLRTSTPSGSAGSFSLRALTPKGVAGLAHIERVLGTLEVIDERIPHGDSL